MSLQYVMSIGGIQIGFAISRVATGLAKLSETLRPSRENGNLVWGHFSARKVLWVSAISGLDYGIMDAA